MTLLNSFPFQLCMCVGRIQYIHSYLIPTNLWIFKVIKPMPHVCCLCWYFRIPNLKISCILHINNNHMHYRWFLRKCAMVKMNISWKHKLINVKCHDMRFFFFNRLYGWKRFMRLLSLCQVEIDYRCVSVGQPTLRNEENIFE